MSSVFTVSEITGHIVALFEQDEALADVTVTGEVSNAHQARSGHWYFTLKDADAQLRCVMFRFAALRQSIEPREGEALSARGKISVYKDRGEYQLYVEHLQSAGHAGDLFQQLEERRQKLAAEGLFDAERKRPLPPLPRTIGIVTSADAAALQDILNVLRRRYPLAHVILSPTLVQGVDAPSQIIRAIQRLLNVPDVDVMIVARGGGSIEDLWSFNDENVVRAVASSPIPTVCGVGHETDTTLVDFVADVRAPTPSAAAEVVVPDVADIRASLQQIDTRMRDVMNRRLTQSRENIGTAVRALDRAGPQRQIELHRLRLDELTERQRRSIAAHLDRLGERVRSRQAALTAASPQSILSRGYAIVTRATDGKVIRQPDDAPPPTLLNIRLKDGHLTAETREETE